MRSTQSTGDLLRFSPSQSLVDLQSSRIVLAVSLTDVVRQLNVFATIYPTMIPRQGNAIPPISCGIAVLRIRRRPSAVREPRDTVNRGQAEV